MRPKDPKRTSHSADLARVRLLLKAKAGWLSGYPYRRTWRCLALDRDQPTEVVTIDRSALTSLLRARKKLKRDYPEGLEKAVGDARAWLRGVQVVATAIKDWVHKNARPPASLLSSGLYPATVEAQAADLEAQHPWLGKSVAAISWVLATRAGDLPRWLRWLEAHSDELRVAVQWMKPQQAIDFVVQCTAVGVDVGNSVSPLIDIAGMPAAYTMALSQGQELAKQAEEQPTKSLSMPEPALESTLQRWAEWLASHDGKDRRRFLKLLARADLAAIITAWSVWWPAMEDGARVLRRTVAKNENQKSARAAVAALKQTCPDAVSLVALTDSLEWFSSVDQKEMHSEICKVLDAVGPTLSLAFRPGLLNHWHRLDRHEPQRRGRLRLLLREMAGYLRGRQDLGHAAQPWLSAARQMARRPQYVSTVDDEILDLETPSSMVRPTFRALAILADRKLELELDEPAERIAELMPLVGDVDRTVEIVEDLVAGELHDEYLYESVGKATLAASEVGSHGFADLLRGILRLNEHTRMDVDKLYRLVAAHYQGHRELLNRIIVDDDHGALIRCAQKLAALTALGGKTGLNLPASKDSSWLESYPPALHPALRALAWASPDAEAMAHRAVRRLLRDSASLAHEREKIRSLIADAEGTQRQRLETRLVSIEARLRGSAEIPPKKLANLARRLERRAAIARIEALEVAAGSELSSAMQRLLKVPHHQPWFDEARTLRILAPMLALSGQTCKLGVRLLRVRCGPPPWDLRDAAANSRFISKMQRQGIDMQPWLDGTVEHTVKRNGVRHHLALEPDPLEVFVMGDHFDTCLSPGQFNFFSVFANAADINKRVLYMRDDKDKVVARQLLCLTDNGRLVSFHAYAHSDVGFPKLAQRFASELADQMGTVLASDGNVSTLVSYRWYDDGIIDSAHQFDALTESSPFRRALAKADPDDLPELLRISETALSPIEVSLPMMLRLPEIRGAPERVVALVPWMREVGELSGRTAIEAALLLEEAGRAETGAELFGDAVERQVRTYAIRDRWLYYQAAIWLARHRPSAALRLLRDSRPRGVRSWADEESADRLVTAGLAFETLHRLGQAADCYQLAARSYGAAEVKRFARGRARALRDG
jgi:hypothetical protein